MDQAGLRARARSSFRIDRTFAALKFYNYRMWFAGQLVSLIGSWMQTTAQGFLVFQLTNSPAYLGLVAFAAGIPSWILMLYGGVIADRIPRRTVLIITQTLLMILAFILSALSFTGLVQPWHIIVLALGVGVANAFDAPARISFVREMVDKEAMTNAIALNSMMFQTSTVVGPAAAGVTYALVGPAWCFFINGLSYLAVIAALLLMKIDHQELAQRASSGLQDLREGLGYVRGHPMILAMLLIAVFTSMVGLGYVTLLPAWAVDVLGGDATTNGLMQSARGVGALIGAIGIASLGNFRKKGMLLTLACFVYPALVIVFALARSTWLSLLLLVGVGMGSLIIFNMLLTIMQSMVVDELRGRVMSLYSLTFFGGMPLGALLIGAIAEHFGEPSTVIASGILSLLFAAFLVIKMPRIRQAT